MFYVYHDIVKLSKLGRSTYCIMLRLKTNDLCKKMNKQRQELQPKQADSLDFNLFAKCLRKTEAVLQQTSEVKS